MNLRFDEIVALDTVSFELHAGDTRVVLGAAGSGKTTLLKAAIGLIRPDSGKIYLFGQEITGLKEAQLFHIRSGVGVLFQEGGLFDSVTVEENVAYPLLNRPSIPNRCRKWKRKSGKLCGSWSWSKPWSSIRASYRVACGAASASLARW